MPPPELTGYAPILHIFHPVPIGILKFSRLKLNVIIHYMLQSRCTKLLHLQEPLKAQLGFDHCIGTLAVTHLIHVILHLYQVPGRFQFRYDLLSCLETVHSQQDLCSLIQSPIVVEYIDGLQVVLNSQLVVIDIVCRSDLQCSRTKLTVHIGIHNDGHRPVNQRYKNFFPVEFYEAFIFRVDTNCCIAQDGFRSGGGNGNVVILPFKLVSYII